MEPTYDRMFLLNGTTSNPASFYTAIPSDRYHVFYMGSSFNSTVVADRALPHFLSIPEITLQPLPIASATGTACQYNPQEIYLGEQFVHSQLNRVSVESAMGTTLAMGTQKSVCFTLRFSKRYRPQLLNLLQPSIRGKTFDRCLLMFNINGNPARYDLSLPAGRYRITYLGSNRIVQFTGFLSAITIDSSTYLLPFENSRQYSQCLMYIGEVPISSGIAELTLRFLQTGASTGAFSTAVMAFYFRFELVE